MERDEKFNLMMRYGIKGWVLGLCAAGECHYFSLRPHTP